MAGSGGPPRLSRAPPQGSWVPHQRDKDRPPLPGAGPLSSGSSDLGGQLSPSCIPKVLQRKYGCAKVLHLGAACPKHHCYVQTSVCTVWACVHVCVLWACVCMCAQIRVCLHCVGTCVRVRGRACSACACTCVGVCVHVWAGTSRAWAPTSAAVREGRAKARSCFLTSCSGPRSWSVPAEGTGVPGPRLTFSCTVLQIPCFTLGRCRHAPYRAVN